MDRSLDVFTLWRCMTLPPPLKVAPAHFCCAASNPVRNLNRLDGPVPDAADSALAARLVILRADTVLAEEPVEALALDAGASGGLGDVAVELGHEANEVLARGAVACQVDDLAVQEMSLGAARG